MSTELTHFLAKYREHTNGLLEERLNGLKHYNTDLIEAMRYSLLLGGKRVRPVLVYAAAYATGGISAAADDCACAIEAIHTYSLIHDDLPAMDDDALRRGQPTCHIAYSEATAILAGDALQCQAFEWLANSQHMPATAALQAIAALSKASGASGMVLGQAIDLAAVDKSVDLQHLENMHQHKTGALICASVEMGAIAAGANPAQTAQLRQYASAIGLAFQVQDDILDVTANTATLGKEAGADAERNKPTYVSLLGLDGAKHKASELLQQALASIKDFDERADILRQLATYIVQRDH
ncbi:polyprenyl synthetase family protein [Saccharophagus degradans]|uniref:Polyprenyl synthetase family protein n=1 Tax=Saccharophagus degradans TaxID=86304 RepID=A0AAW7X1P0_9GAMM|nr:farnesyl diphosphate synthase [Saccharophagus degradans]MDO6421409.1 polyprenyl synthetase family protein [Saccharophagus degradans]MDO6608777.1 polyprenyl synthetase family protein [Saccharophagus degradans]